MKHLLIILIAFFAIVISMPVAYCDPTSASIAGDWRGALDVGGKMLHIAFHITPKADGTLTATFDSLDQGASGIPFSSASLAGRTLLLTADKIGASFKGTLNAKETKIDGDWTQGGADFSLTLTRSEKNAETKASAAPEPPMPPVPYVVRDVTFPGGATGVTLAATLTLPQGAGPFPVTVLICGSGAHDRDETILGHKPFALLADTLTRRGIAVLRYDKRGVAKSTGSYAAATTADFGKDAEAAVAFLKTQTEIDPKRIGLLGHSEGGLIAPMVASEDRSIAFIVLMAGPGMTGEKILLAQSTLINKAEGATDAKVAQNTALQTGLFAIAKRESDPKIARQEAEALVLKSLDNLTPAEKSTLGDLRAFAAVQSQAVLSPWFRYFLTYDPIPALKATQCPVLALDGSLDLQVPPKEDLSAIAAALKAGGNTKATIRELPGLNHLFQTCKTGSPSEYATIKETIAPIALTTIGDWIIAQTGAHGAP